MQKGGILVNRDSETAVLCLGFRDWAAMGVPLEMHKLPADGGGVTRLQEIATSYVRQ